MNKKNIRAIGVALVLGMLLFCFVACGHKKESEKIEPPKEETAGETGGDKKEEKNDHKEAPKELSEAEWATLRKSYLDFCAKYRVDLMPNFAAGQAPQKSKEYLYWAFAINLENWGEDKGVMQKTYIDEKVQAHFGVDNLIHESFPKNWDFDGEKYIAVPQGIPEEPDYYLSAYQTHKDKEGIFYEIVIQQVGYEEEYFDDETTKKHHEQIISGKIEGLNLGAKEILIYRLEGDTPLFISHQIEQ